jgi:hypothetical protein
LTSTSDPESMASTSAWKSTLLVPTFIVWMCSNTGCICSHHVSSCHIALKLKAYISKIFLVPFLFHKHRLSSWDTACYVGDILLALGGYQCVHGLNGSSNQLVLFTVLSKHQIPYQVALKLIRRSKSRRYQGRVFSGLHLLLEINPWKN